MFWDLKTFTGAIECSVMKCKTSHLDVCTSIGTYTYMHHIHTNSNPDVTHTLGQVSKQNFMPKSYTKCVISPSLRVDPKKLINVNKKSNKIF